jgi:hypothetical protein
MPTGRFIVAFTLFLTSLFTLGYLIPGQIVPTDNYAVSARLMPYFATGVILALSGLESIRQWRSPETGGRLQSTELRALLIVTGTLIVAAILFLQVHPLAAGVFGVNVLLLDMGERRPIVLICLPGVLMALTYWLLYHVLGSGIA